MQLSALKDTIEGGRYPQEEKKEVSQLQARGDPVDAADNPTLAPTMYATRSSPPHPGGVILPPDAEGLKVRLRCLRPPQRFSNMRRARVSNSQRDLIPIEGRI
ncbi:hypothetical protein U1Q18_015433 [Sarracenia purpurea var. burkii]